MSIISCKKTNKRRSIIDGRVTRHEFTYLIKTDDPNDGTAVAVACGDLPEIGDRLDADDTVECISLECEPKDCGNGCDFFVIATYATRVSDEPLFRCYHPVKPTFIDPATVDNDAIKKKITGGSAAA